MTPTTPPGASASTPSRGEALAREGYSRHGAELYRTARARLGDDAGAQDAVQETIVRAWRAADRFDPARGSLRTWLFAILRNVVHDHRASRARAPEPTPDATADAHGGRGGPGGVERGSPDPAQRVVDSDLVARALGDISEDHRTAIVETYLRDRSYAEVAAELGVPVSTLRSRVFHGLRDLRATIITMEVER